MNIRSKLALLFLLFASPVLAQNALVPVPPIFVGPATNPHLAAGVTITFCSSTATGSPCSPLAQAYSDSTNSFPINQVTNPIKTDALGNAQAFYAAPGQYSYTITGPGIGIPQGPYQVTVSCIPGTTCVATSANNAFTGNNTHSGTEMFTGPLNSNNLAAGNVANEPATSDAVVFVSKNGNDSNTGHSLGKAFATPQAALASLPNCTVSPGQYNGIALPTITAPCGTVYLAENTSGYSISSTLAMNGLLTRIIGMGKSPVVLNCTTTPCITISNLSPFGNPGLAALYPSDGGLYNLNLNGNGSASQIGLNGLVVSGLVLTHVIFSNFSGTSANAVVLTNDTTSAGYTEEMDWNNVTFNNCTNGVLLTTTGGSPNPSFGHNAWRHMQWILGNGQTALSLSGSASLYSSYSMDGVINGNDPNAAHTATAYNISGTANIKSNLSFPIDNGGGLTINLCTGCTNSNFQIWGMEPANPGLLFAINAGIWIDQIPSPVFGGGLNFRVNGVNEWFVSPDGSNNLKFFNASNNPVFGFLPGSTLGYFLPEAAAPGGIAGNEVCHANSTLHMQECNYNGTATFPIPQTGNTGGTHSDSGFYQTATAAGCTTAASIGGVCASPFTVTWPVAFADTNYKMSCSPNGAATNLPSTPYIVTKSAGSVTMNYFAITAAAASWPNVECTAVHN